MHGATNDAAQCSPATPPACSSMGSRQLQELQHVAFVTVPPSVAPLLLPSPADGGWSSVKASLTMMSLEMDCG